MRSKLLLQLKLFAAHASRQRGRMLLTLLAVVIGVASVTGILVLNRSAYRSFEDAVAGIAGSAQFEIANGSVGVPDDLIWRIRNTPGVLAAAGVTQDFVRLPAIDNRRVCLLGVEFGGDSRVWSGLFDLDAFDIEDELELVDDPRAVLLSETLTGQGGWETGDTVVVTTPLGATELTVRGSFAAQRFANVYQGDVALMDLRRAQAAFAKKGRFDWINVVAAPDADLAAVGVALEDVVRGYAQVSTPLSRGKRVESMLRTNRWMLTISSLFAASVGLFLVAQSMYTSTEQRGVTYATLRCLGASRAQLAAAVLLEAGVLAVVGSALGVAAGLAFCKLALGPFGVFLSITYTQVRPSALVVAAPDLAAALAIGVGATLAGAVAPAAAIASVPPIRSVRTAPVRSNGRGASIALGAALCIAGLAIPSVRLPREWFAAQTAQVFAAIVVVLVGAALLTPLVLDAAGLLVRPVVRRVWGSVGHWLWRRIATGGRRTTLTIAPLAAGFSFATLMSVFIASYRTAVIDYLETSFPADVILNVGPPMSMLAGPVASVAVMDEVRAMAGVESVAPVRFIEGIYEGNSIVVQGIGDEILRHRFDETALDFAQNEVVISDTLSERYALAAGDRFALDTPTGRMEMTVKVVEPDYFLDLGSVKLPWSVFSERWRESKANMFLVRLDEGADPAALKAQIDAQLAGRHDLTVLTRNDTRAAINALIDSTFALMFLCEGLAILVAVIAVMNGVVAAMLDRADQLCILRTVGLTPRSLRRLVLLEGAIIGFVGGVIGLAAGAALSHRVLTVSFNTVGGFLIPVEWPVGALALGVAAAVASGAVAGALAFRGARFGVPVPQT